MGLKGVRCRDEGQGPSRATLTFTPEEGKGAVVTYQKRGGPQGDTPEEFWQALADHAELVERTADMPLIWIWIKPSGDVAIATKAKPDDWPSSGVFP